MDDTRYESILKQLRCAEKTKVHIYDSRRQTNNEDWSDDADLLTRLRGVSSLINNDSVHTPQDAPTNQTPMFVISTTGVADLDSKYGPLNISISSLQVLIDSCSLPREIVHLLGTRLPHVSHHFHYETGSLEPSAISVLARLPRNSIHITIALRVRLRDNACVCLLITKTPEDALEIKKLFIRRRHQLAKYPFLLLSLIIEYRLAWYESWLDRLWSRVDDLETTTCMTAWPRTGSWTSSIQDYEPILQELHAVNVELIVADTTMKFARTFAEFCGKTLIVVEDSRKQLGLPEMPFSHRQQIETAIAFSTRLIEFRDDKFHELSSRVKSQINVTFSLVTQQDSRTNARIAESAARDSQTMKTITVITLFFLPSTLLATIWSSGIFTMEPERSWKVFVGTSVALTVVVFATWILYRTYLPPRLRQSPKGLSP